MKIIETESGAIYEIDDNRVRRVNPADQKRGDGDWQTLISQPHIEIGHPMTLVMESLAHLGTDDYGTRRELASSYTTRRTTAVAKVTD